jgi:cyanophycinase
MTSPTRIAAGLLVLSCLLAAPPAAVHAQGRLVIAGGGVSRDNAPLYDALLDGRHGEGPVCVIPTASDGLDGARSSMNSSVATFERHGGAGTAIGLLMSTDNPEAAHDADVVAQVRRCSGFWFTGGVHSRTVALLRPDGAATPVLEALRARFHEGALVGGSSAGAAIMSDPMIAGGSPATALDRGVSITPGIGFLPGAVVDQHFLARGRIGRLIAAVLDHDAFDLGFGVDEDTGLVVDGSAVHAVGTSGVVIVDARDAVHDGRSARDVKLHLLSAGDRFDMGTRRLVPDVAKQPLAAGAHGAGSGADAPHDIFARWAFLHLLHAFARSPQQEVHVPFDGGAMVLRKGDAFSAVSSGGAGVEGTPAGFTVRDVRVDVRRH